MLKFKKKSYNYGLTFFRIGIFLLASAPFISGLLFITSLSITFIEKNQRFFQINGITLF